MDILTMKKEMGDAEEPFSPRRWLAALGEPPRQLFVAGAAASCEHCCSASDWKTPPLSTKYQRVKLERCLDGW